MPTYYAWHAAAKHYNSVMSLETDDWRVDPMRFPCLLLNVKMYVVNIRK